MRNIVILFGLFCFAVPGVASQVSKLGKDPSMLLVTQDSGKRWSVGDYVCVWSGKKKAGCGSVTKVSPKSALVVLSEAGDGATAVVGDMVVASGRSPASSGQSLERVRDEKGSFSRTQISVELFGNALLYSLMGSYRPAKSLAINLGASYFGASSSTGSGTSFTTVSSSILQFPLSVSYLMGSQNSFFEVLGGVDLILISGGATSLGVDSSASTGLTPVPNVGLGYRYWPLDGGFHFRVTAYCFFGARILPWGGLTFGIAI